MVHPGSGLAAPGNAGVVIRHALQAFAFQRQQAADLQAVEDHIRVAAAFGVQSVGLMRDARVLPAMHDKRGFIVARVIWPFPKIQSFYVVLVTISFYFTLNLFNSF